MKKASEKGEKVRAVLKLPVFKDVIFEGTLEWMSLYAVQGQGTSFYEVKVRVRPPERAVLGDRAEEVRLLPEYTGSGDLILGEMSLLEHLVFVRILNRY